MREKIEKWYEKDLKEGIISSPLQTNALAKSIADAIPKKKEYYKDLSHPEVDVHNAVIDEIERRLRK